MLKSTARWGPSRRACSDCARLRSLRGCGKLEKYQDNSFSCAKICVPCPGSESTLFAAFFKTFFGRRAFKSVPEGMFLEEPPGGSLRSSSRVFLGQHMEKYFPLQTVFSLCGLLVVFCSQAPGATVVPQEITDQLGFHRFIMCSGKWNCLQYYPFPAHADKADHPCAEGCELGSGGSTWPAC